MDKILKLLLKLNEKERSVILQIMHDIVNNTLETYDTKKLINQESLRRIRKGNIRIIFCKKESGNTIINIDRRGSVYE